MKSAATTMPPHSKLPGEGPWVLTEDETTSSRPLKTAESKTESTVESSIESKNNSMANKTTRNHLPETSRPLDKDKNKAGTFPLRIMAHTVVDQVADSIEYVMRTKYIMVLLLGLMSAMIPGIAKSTILTACTVYLQLQFPPTEELNEVLPAIAVRPQQDISKLRATARRHKKALVKPRTAQSPLTNPGAQLAVIDPIQAGRIDAIGRSRVMVKFLIVFIFVSVLIMEFLVWTFGNAKETHLGHYSCVTDTVTGLPNCVEV
ncbi:hypothetical protein CKM354_001132300 [Cercospora kikuchii]|uniref:Uncharacterized protein n=1 Tax=Cercospora kikuchii TaxID=84275 RepID=A0A9P3FL81_9PEZI|nr:uncharacterized protein CKM354_001132300 [Cercospora kikuchii]GIZ48255.1 hypothetical protein CKM354_001132300 [Cercospora kikuchii]